MCIWSLFVYVSLCLWVCVNVSPLSWYVNESKCVKSCLCVYLVYIFNFFCIYLLKKAFIFFIVYLSIIGILVNVSMCDVSMCDVSMSLFVYVYLCLCVNLSMWPFSIISECHYIYMAMCQNVSKTVYVSTCLSKTLSKISTNFNKMALKGFVLIVYYNLFSQHRLKHFPLSILKYC